MKLTRRLRPLAPMRSIVVWAAQGELFEQLRGLLGAQGAQAVQLILAGAHNEANGRSAAALAGVLLLFGATSVFAELKASLDDIWQEPPLTTGTLWTRYAPACCPSAWCWCWRFC